MRKGDLVVIVESLPNWAWATYTTGHVGMVTKVRIKTINSRDPIYEIFFFHNLKTHPVLKSFLRPLDELDDKG